MPQSAPTGILSPFLSKDEYVFQLLCREVLSNEADIGSCEVFGTRGQGQLGIDLIASRRSDGNREVGQCKRYKVLTVRHVKDASTEFFENWDYWKSHGIVRFVLIAACDISSQKLQAEFLNQRRAFRKKRIKYEAWGLNELSGKLRSFRQAVQSFYGPETADQICGPVAETPELRAATRFLQAQMGVVLTELETERSDQLQALREKSREGHHRQALADVEKIKAAGSWSSHSPQLKARFLRFEAALRLNLKERPEVASGLVSQAKAIDPTGDFQTIDAYLAYRTSSPNQALDLLKTPQSIDAWNLRWAILVEAGRFNEVPAEIKSLPTSIQMNAETHRMLSIIALCTGNITDAQTNIISAKNLSSRHREVKFTAALVDYFSSIATEPGERLHLSWPIPVGWALVKRDPDSVARLRRAADEFRDLSGETTYGDEEWLQLNTWQLACVSSDSERHSDAVALLSAILTANPTHYPAAVWAVERGLEFDKNKVAQALSEKISKSISPNPDPCLGLCAILLSLGKVADAESTLDGFQQIFEAAHARDVWCGPKAQFLARRGQLTEALALVDTMTDGSMRTSARASALRAASKTEEDFRKLAVELESDYRTSGSAYTLFACCEVCSRTQEWKVIADHAKELVERINTDTALRLALHGTFSHRKYDLCLELIRDHTTIFHGGQLSAEIRALRAECQKKLGHWQDAITEAESLYRELPSAQRFSNLFRLLVEIGDLPRCALLARDLFKLPDTYAALFLQAAKVARLHDHELAKALWLRAQKPPLDDANLMTVALGLAYELGIENQAVSIQNHLFKLAQSDSNAPLKLVSIEEMQTKFAEGLAEHQRVNQLYNSLAAPIHLVGRHLHTPLIEFYHSNLARNRESADLLQAPALLARYGGRKMPEQYTCDTLYADITGLLLAAELKILDLVESALGMITIAPEVTPSLLEQIAKILPNQPSQHTWRGHLLKLIDTDNIHVTTCANAVQNPSAQLVGQLGEDWASQWRAAVESNAILIADYPLLTCDTNPTQVSLSSDIAAHVCNVREFLKSLYLAGVLSEADWQTASGPGTRLSTQPERPDEQLQWPKTKSFVISDAVFPALLNEGWLESAKYFHLCVSSSFVMRVKDEEKSYTRREECAEWAKQLLSHIQRGIAEKRYFVLPEIDRPDVQKNQLGLDGVGIGTLLHAIGESKTGVLWCDDRMINQHLMSGSRPIVGIVEILRMLQAKGVLSEDDYFNKISYLRQSNVRYLPVTTEELMHLIKSARVVNNRLIETPALMILRRYTNACLLDRERLATPHPTDSGAPKDIREFEFVFQVRRAGDDVLREIWGQKDSTPETIRAQADWLWSAIYVEVLGIRQALIPGERTLGEERELTAFALGATFSLGMTLPHTGNGDSFPNDSPRKAYYSWLVERVLLPLESSNPGFIKLVAKVIARDVVKTTRAVARVKSPQEALANRVIMCQLVWNLPNELLQELDLPTDVLESIGLKANGPTIQVNGSDFDFASFWAAQAEAVNNRPSRVKDRSEKCVLTLTRSDLSDTIVLAVSDSVSGETKTSRDLAYPLMLDKTADRVAYLEQHSGWFDCAEARKREAIQSIVATPSPGDRANLAHRWINESVAEKYANLTRMLNAQERVSLDEFRVSSWPRMIEHLRLPDNQMLSPAAALEEAANVLIREEGLTVALERFSFLPIHTPSSLAEAWKAASFADASKIWAQLRQAPLTPVTGLHLVRLNLLRADFEASLAKPILDELFDAAKSESLIDSFIGILKWVCDDFMDWQAKNAIPAWQRLAAIWYHAGRSHQLFRIGHADLEKLTGWIGDQTPSWNEGVLRHDPEFREDILHPSDTSSGKLIINGLVNIVADFPEQRTHPLHAEYIWERLVAENPKYVVKLQTDLLHRTDSDQNIFAALISCPKRSDAERIFGKSIETMFLPNSDQDITNWIAAIRTNPYDHTSWVMLHAALRDSPVPASCRDVLKDVLLTIDFAEFVKREPRWGGVTLLFAAGQARHIRDSALSKYVEQQVFSTAYARRAEIAEPESNLALWIMQALLPLSITANDETATAQKYFSSLERLIRTQPALAQILAPMITQWSTSLPFAQQRAFWPFLLSVRALS